MKFIPTITEPVYPPEGTKRTGRGYYWTPRELQVIRERYLSEGLEACLKLLPVRNRQGLMNQATKMGLRRQRPHRKPKASTEMIDAAIRRLYAAPMGKGELKSFCARYGTTRQWVQRRASILGCAVRMPKNRLRPDGWTEAENAIVERYSTRSPEAISKALKRAGFQRTPSACAGQRWKLCFDSTDPDIMTANALALAMGIDSHAVLRWIERHGLKAKQGAPGGLWQIRRADLRRWLIESAAWDHRRCNREWLIEMLAGRVGVAADAERAA